MNYGLSDFPFQVWWNRLLGLLPSGEWERDLNKVFNRTNWNLKCYISPCIELTEVRSIIAIYGNLAGEKQIPEYQVENAGLKKYVELKVNEIYGQDINTVETVLWNLYWATKDGTLSSNVLLQPVKYVQNKDKRETPKNIPSAGDDLESLLTLIKWTILIVGIGYGITILLPLFETARKSNGK